MHYWDGTGQFITHQFPANTMEYGRFATLYCQVRTWSPFFVAKKPAPWHRWSSLYYDETRDMSLLPGLRAPLDELSSHVRGVSQFIPKKAKESYLGLGSTL